MSTRQRPTVSMKNCYWISKHRYYELKHFCLQYYDWKASYDEIDSLPTDTSLTKHPHSTETSNRVPFCADMARYFSSRIDLINTIAFEAGDYANVSELLLQAVTEDLSYDALEVREGHMPVSRSEWYLMYRKFFWLLDKRRG